MSGLESLEALATEGAQTENEAPVHVQKLDEHGRAYATGKRKDAIARVWVKPGAGRISGNGKDLDRKSTRLGQAGLGPHLGERQGFRRLLRTSSAADDPASADRGGKPRRSV